MAPLKTVSQAASLAMTSARILVAVEICSSPPLSASKPSRNLLPYALLVFGGNALLTPFLNSRETVLERILIAWRPTLAFNAALAWNPSHS